MQLPQNEVWQGIRRLEQIWGYHTSMFFLPVLANMCRYRKTWGSLKFGERQFLSGEDGIFHMKEFRTTLIYIFTNVFSMPTGSCILSINPRHETLRMWCGRSAFAAGWFLCYCRAGKGGVDDPSSCRRFLHPFQSLSEMSRGQERLFIDFKTWYFPQSFSWSESAIDRHPRRIRANWSALSFI